MKYINLLHYHYNLVAAQGGEIGQEAQPLDGVIGAADRMQLHAQLAQPGVAGAQPAEQGGVLVVVVQPIGGQADAHGNHPGEWGIRDITSPSRQFVKVA